VVHTDRPIRETEFVGTAEVELSELEKVLWAGGFHRNPIAAIKTREGVPEVGSWVWRKQPTAQRQVHVMLFKNAKQAGQVDIYAHEEYSCINPKVAVKHYFGTDQKERLGVKQVRSKLSVDGVPRHLQAKDE
jgi:hypothetical protein